MEEVTKLPQLNDSQRTSLRKANTRQERADILDAPTRTVKLLKFPDEQSDTKAVPCTIGNVKTILDAHGIVVRYNMMTKDVDVQIPDQKGTIDNKAEASLAHIISLAASYAMQTFNVPMFLDAIADEHAYHPLAEWVQSKPWDGVDRLDRVYATVEVAEDYPEPLRDELIRRWLLSIVAAALMPRGFHGRGVLTLQGPQGIGKTSWLRRLINHPDLRETAIKTDHHLDPSNKDSVLGAIRHAIVEIGEVDSSFKKDIARLKGFITADSDKIRKPYARRASDHARRTVFMATVNEQNYLVDQTGNTRWWTIRATKIDYQHDIDMQQVFAQLAVDFEKGEKWWLDGVLEKALEAENRHHQMASVVEDMVIEAIDLTASEEARQRSESFTASGLLMAIGIDRPTNAQAREAGTILRKHFGQPKRIHGREKWRVPLHATHAHEPSFGDERERIRPKPTFV